jgi:hypothetical protein
LTKQTSRRQKCLSKSSARCTGIRKEIDARAKEVFKIIDKNEESPREFPVAEERDTALQHPDNFEIGNCSAIDWSIKSDKPKHKAVIYGREYSEDTFRSIHENHQDPNYPPEGKERPAFKEDPPQNTQKVCKCGHGIDEHHGPDGYCERADCPHCMKFVHQQKGDTSRANHDLCVDCGEPLGERHLCLKALRQHDRPKKRPGDRLREHSRSFKPFSVGSDTPREECENMWTYEREFARKSKQLVLAAGFTEEQRELFFQIAKMVKTVPVDRIDPRWVETVRGSRYFVEDLCVAEQMDAFADVKLKATAAERS